AGSVVETTLPPSAAEGRRSYRPRRERSRWRPAVLSEVGSPAAAEVARHPAEFTVARPGPTGPMILFDRRLVRAVGTGGRL
ncbi:MAG TPA: hypothetical protein VNO87_07045, partial [Methylomirabilota bacterium]|nr:hypothetical protein [Methylomirabilota bacterium]